jgi:hypothetical protein
MRHYFLDKHNNLGYNFSSELRRVVLVATGGSAASRVVYDEADGQNV